MHRQILLIFAGLLSTKAVGPLWGVWGEWGAACSECTGTVSRGRTRVCIPGDDLSLCSGSRLDEELCLDCTPQWTEWTIGTECSDTCGYCGRYSRTRECQSPAGCPTPASDSCTGNSTDENTDPCDSGEVCLYPRSSCCMGIKTVDTSKKRFHCKI